MKKICYLSDTEFYKKDNIQRFQQMAIELANFGYKVDYIFSNTKPCKENVSENLTIIRMDEKLISNKILNSDYDCIFLDWPYLGVHVPENYSGKIFYGIIDDHDLVKDLYKNLDWDFLHSKLIQTAYCVYASSEILVQKYSKERPDIILLENGVRPEDWVVDINDKSSVDIKSYYDNLKESGYKKIVGYFGCVSWWMDFESINFAAKNSPDTAFVFIGHKWLLKDEYFDLSLKNIFYKGPEKYHNLKYHVNCFDVAIIPFKINDMTNTVNPIKLYEYTASGAPVISSKLHDVLRTNAPISYYNNKTDFLDKINRCTPRINSVKNLNVDNFVKNNSWKNRVSQIMNKIDDTPNILESFYDFIVEDYTFKSMTPRKTSDLCVATLVDSKHTKCGGNYFFKTHPKIMNYCRRYNLDYHVIVGIPGQSFAELMYEKFHILKLLGIYDRVLFLDADVYVQDFAENIFDLVPKECLGMFMESDVTPYGPMFQKKWMVEYCGKTGEQNIYNYDKYYNAGTIVASKIHAEVFKTPNIKILNNMNEQGYINWYVQKNNIKMFDIGKRFSGWFSKNVENEDHLDLFFGCDFIHFPGQKKLDRILKYENFLKKSTQHPKKVIFSKNNNFYNKDELEIISQKRLDGKTLRNSSGTGQNLKAGFEILKIVDNFNVGVEIGCYTGEFSEIFAGKFKKFYCVDVFSDYNTNGVKSVYGSGSEKLFDERMSKFKNMEKVKGFSQYCVNKFEDESLNFVYIDANHDYQYVGSDITLWYQKVKPGGWIGGHDYNRDVYENSVIKSVNERFGSPDYIFDDGSWLVKKTESNNIPIMTIVIPCFNGIKYADRCFNSLSNQTCKNFEIIVVDDCSTDGSFEYMCRKKLNNMKIYKLEKNSGPGACRNFAIKKSIGEYILPVDIDNYLENDCVETHIKSYNTTISDVIYSSFKTFGIQNDIIKSKPHNPTLLQNMNYIENCSSYRKLVWYNVDGYDENDMVRGYEDWDLWLRMSDSGYKFTNVEKSLFNYYCHEDSLVHTANKNRSAIITYMKSKYKKYPDLKPTNIIIKKHKPGLNSSRMFRK